MSRSTLHCYACRRPVAVKHHSGRIAADDRIKVVILASGAVELRCGCGSRRVVKPRPLLLPEKCLE